MPGVDDYLSLVSRGRNFCLCRHKFEISFQYENKNYITNTVYICSQHLILSQQIHTYKTYIWIFLINHFIFTVTHNFKKILFTILRQLNNLSTRFFCFFLNHEFNYDQHRHISSFFTLTLFLHSFKLMYIVL